MMVIVRLLALWLSVGACAASQTAWAQPLFVISDQAPETHLVETLEYVEDLTGDWGIEQVDEHIQGFQAVGQTTPSFGFTHSAYWFRFSLHNRTEESTLILEAGYPVLDDVRVYAESAEGDPTVMFGGDQLPFSARARPTGTLTFELHQAPGTTNTYYVRVHTGSSMHVPLTVYTERAFAASAGIQSTLLSVYYGMLLIMLLFNGLLWLSLRDRAYLYYVLYVFITLVAQTTLNGSFPQYLFGNAPQLSNALVPMSISGAWAMALLFSRTFLNLETHSHHAHFLYRVFESLLWLNALLSIVVPYALSIEIAFAFSLMAPILIVASTSLVLRRGYTPARVLLLAFLSLLSGSLIYTLKSRGILPSNLLTTHALQIGSALEITLLALALANRFTLLQKAAYESHRLLLKKSEDLTDASFRRSAAEAELHHTLSTRLYLFSDLAHRVSHPLYVIRQAVESLHGNAMEVAQILLRGFGPPSTRDEDEQAAFDFIRDTAQALNLTVEDSSASLDRVDHLVQELRIIAGAEDENAERIHLGPIFEDALQQIRQDLGTHPVQQLKIEQSVRRSSAYGIAPIFRVAISAWLKDAVARAPERGAILIDTKHGETDNALWLRATVDNGEVFQTESSSEFFSGEAIFRGLLNRKGGEWTEVHGASGVFSISIRLANSANAWNQPDGDTSVA